MILPSDSTDDKLADLASSEPAAPDAPPPYTEIASLEPLVERPSDISHLAASYDVPPLLTQRPCNWVYAYIANGLIQDQYILDPSLKVPNVLLSDSVSGTLESERDALNLRSQTATIDAVARIVDSGGVKGDRDAMPRRVKIVLHSNTGTIMGKIVWQSHLNSCCRLLIIYRSYPSTALRLPNSTSQRRLIPVLCISTSPVLSTASYLPLHPPAAYISVANSWKMPR